MADWILIPCLRALFMEFDRLAPDRPKDSDGSIGDFAHQQESSDHNPDETGNVPIRDADKINEVHAIDVTNKLGSKVVRWRAYVGMEAVVQYLLDRCRSGAEKRLRYIIYNRRIWSASSSWVQKTYAGPSPHTEHAHFSASYVTSLEASTAPWFPDLEGEELSPEEKTWLLNEMGTRISGAKQEILNALPAIAEEAAKKVWATQFDRVNPTAEQVKAGNVRVTAGALQQFSEESLRQAKQEILDALKPLLQV